MPRRQGLLFQPNSDPMAKVLYAQRSANQVFGAMRPGVSTKTKAGKESGLSALSKTVALGELAYKGYDALSPVAEGAGKMTSAEVEASNAGLEVGKEALAAEELAAKEGVSQVASGLASEAGTTAGAEGAAAETGLGSEIMAAGSAAWSEVATGAEAAWTWLLALL